MKVKNFYAEKCENYDFQIVSLAGILALANAGILLGGLGSGLGGGIGGFAGLGLTTGGIGYGGVYGGYARTATDYYVSKIRN